jgi:hypothetical protein
MHRSSPDYVPNAPLPSHSSWSDHVKNIWSGWQIQKNYLWLDVTEWIFEQKWTNRFEVLTAMLLNIQVFCDRTLRRIVIPWTSVLKTWTFRIWSSASVNKLGGLFVTLDILSKQFIKADICQASFFSPVFSTLLMLARHACSPVQ